MLALRGWLCSRCGQQNSAPEDVCRNDRCRLSRSLTGVLVSMDSYSTRQRATPSWRSAHAKPQGAGGSSSEPASPAARGSGSLASRKRAVPPGFRHGNPEDDSAAPSAKRGYFSGSSAYRRGTYGRGSVSSGGESDTEQHVFAMRRKRSSSDSASDGGSATASDSEATAPSSASHFSIWPRPFAFPIDEMGAEDEAAGGEGGASHHPPALARMTTAGTDATAVLSPTSAPSFSSNGDDTDCDVIEDDPIDEHGGDASASAPRWACEPAPARHTVPAARVGESARPLGALNAAGLFDELDFDAGLFLDGLSASGDDDADEYAAGAEEEDDEDEDEDEEGEVDVDEYGECDEYDDACEEGDAAAPTRHPHPSVSAALRCHKRRFCTRGYKHFGRGGRCKVREREMRGLAGEASEWARVESGAYAGEDEEEAGEEATKQQLQLQLYETAEADGGVTDSLTCRHKCGRRFHLSATRAMHEQACRKGLASRPRSAQRQGRSRDAIADALAADAVRRAILGGGCTCGGCSCGGDALGSSPAAKLLDWIASNDLPELRSPGLASGDAWRQQQQGQQQQQQPESDEDDAEAAALLALLPPKRDGSCVKSVLCDRPHRHRGRCNRHRLPLVDALRCKREREREEASHNAACAQLERDDQGGYDRALSSLDAPLPAFFDTLGTAAPSLTSASAASSASSESAPSPSRFPFPPLYRPFREVASAALAAEDRLSKLSESEARRDALIEEMSALARRVGDGAAAADTDDHHTALVATGGGGGREAGAEALAATQVRELEQSLEVLRRLINAPRTAE